MGWNKGAIKKNSLRPVYTQTYKQCMENIIRQIGLHLLIREMPVCKEEVMACLLVADKKLDRIPAEKWSKAVGYTIDSRGNEFLDYKQPWIKGARISGETRIQVLKYIATEHLYKE